MEHLDVSYNWILVALSYVISVFGSFTALQLAKQVAGSQEKGRLTWLVAAAFAMGGGAIWSMHFIGMLAFDMGMLVGYDLPLTLFSLLVAVALTGVGLHIASLPGANWGHLAVAGVIMGAGVSSMHYTGMAAMRMNASLTYDMQIVFVSVVIAVIASTAALWLALKTRTMVQMMISAMIMGVAVCGMHYTGMSAASFTFSSPVASSMANTFSPELLAYAIFLMSLLILSVGLAFGSSRVPVQVSVD